MAPDVLNKLIAGCLQQSRSHQKQLYQAFYSLAMGVCQRYAANRHEALHIMNQGFKKVFSAFNQKPSHHQFENWLTGIMIGTAIDYYRPHLIQAKNAGNINTAVAVDKIPKQLHHSKALAMLQALPAAQRVVFNLYAIDDHPLEHICKTIGMEKTTSENQLHTAREKLKQLLSVDSDV